MDCMLMTYEALCLLRAGKLEIDENVMFKWDKTERGHLQLLGGRHLQLRHFRLDCIPLWCAQVGRDQREAHRPAGGGYLRLGVPGRDVPGLPP